MKLVATVHAAANLESAVDAFGAATGLTPAEARMRLVTEAPMLLASLPPERAEALVEALRQAGLEVLAVDAAVPSDAERTVARTFTLGPMGATFQPRTGAAVELPWSEVGAILRGSSSVRSETETVHESKKASLVMTLASQGLKTTRTVERTERSQQEETEQVLFVYGRGGQRIALRERELDFSCLGAAMQPTRMANMVALARLLKEKAPGAFYDERLVRLGRRPLPPFVSSGESLAQVGKTAQKRLDTSRGLDVLAEVLWRGVVARLLP
ncbi:hypothetical protein [Archangium sp.]|jgi:hypothetical protein|uniref:hypothetical protein n=1 Tax=Archangium sp. TaxID=1872627 RepID=UPI0038999F32